MIMINPDDWMRACLPDKEDKRPRSIYIDKDPQQIDIDSWWRDLLTNNTKK